MQGVTALLGGVVEAKCIQSLDHVGMATFASAMAKAHRSAHAMGTNAQGRRGRLRLFLDTADVAAWRTWLPTGVFYGVTTNPTLLERAKATRCDAGALAELAREAFRLGAEEVQLQTWGGKDVDALAQRGATLAAIDPRVVVKVPITEAGARAAHLLVQDGHRVTMTGVYATHQVVSATALGAAYAAPYLGRMNDAGLDGLDAIMDMQCIVDAMESDLRVLVASVREVGEVAKLAAAGVDTFTVSPGVAEQMFAEPLTHKAAEDFEAAAERWS